MIARKRHRIATFGRETERNVLHGTEGTWEKRSRAFHISRSAPGYPRPGILRIFRGFSRHRRHRRQQFARLSYVASYLPDATFVKVYDFLKDGENFQARRISNAA